MSIDLSSTAVRVADTAGVVQSDASERRYRILMIAPTSFFADYGCHVRILEEARTLQRMGHHITIATYRNGRNLPDLHIERTLPIPWRRDYEVGSSRHKLGFDVLLGLKTVEMVSRQWLRGQRFDLIHAHLHEGALIGAVLSRAFGLPLVFDFQGSLTEEMIDHGFLRRASKFYAPVRHMECRINDAADAILTSSLHAKRLLTEQFATPPQRVHALPDCVDTQTFRPAAEHAPAALHALRSRLGIPAEAQVIVYLGLLAPYQGTDLLLDAFARILSAGTNVYLLLMGFPNLDRYRAQAVRLGIAERVIFTGRVPYEEAPLHLALGDVAAAPKLSLTEGAGKLLNYMAVALPTVAFDTPVAREYLGHAGLFAERGSVESLTLMLQTALNAGHAPAAGPASREATLGELLRWRATKHFEWQRAGKDITALYHRLLKSRHHPISI